MLGKRAHFECSVKSPNNAAELEIWWQIREANLTNSARSQVCNCNEKHSVMLRHKPMLIFDPIF